MEINTQVAEKGVTLQSPENLVLLAGDIKLNILNVCGRNYTPSNQEDFFVFFFFKHNVEAS